MRARALLATAAVLAVAGIHVALDGGAPDSGRVPRSATPPPAADRSGLPPLGGPWYAFERWHTQRAYPHDQIPASAFWEAVQHRRTHFATGLQRGGSTWEPLGPLDVAGRMLSLAVDPSDPDRVWAGAASGGLWKTEMAGEGPDAWDYVDTGFPSLSVGTILLDPADPDHLWIGTGEVAYYATPLAGRWGAKSSYGIGVIESTDGGSTWGSTGLTWTRDQNRAVLSLRADPVNSQIVWAATTEGVFRTTDGGVTWALAHDLLMAMDIVVDPTDGNVAFASHGQLGTPGQPEAGLYRTTDAGASWTELSGLLWVDNFGRTELAISASGDTLLAAISASDSHMIFPSWSTDGGDSWEDVFAFDSGRQGWYANAASISPDGSTMLFGSLTVYRRGWNIFRNQFEFFEASSPYRGDPSYVHPDIQAFAWDPSSATTVYVASDGGVFRSTDSGSTWEDRNGGLQTVQFYPGFAATASGSRLLGGTQDNSTLLYPGATTDWDIVFYGDGSWSGIDPDNEDVLYAQSQWRNVEKSTDGGLQWTELLPADEDSAAFIAPLVLSPSDPQVLYSGALGVLRTSDAGLSWAYPDGEPVWNGTPVVTIGVAPTNPDHVLAGTGGRDGVVEIRQSTNGGTTWTDVTAQLPDRYPTGFRFDPRDRDLVWATFGGYGSGHVYRSFDAGLTWADVSANLPDVPHMAVAVDPRNPEVAYVGTDLGVYRTTDGGTGWEAFDAGLPVAHISDLVIAREPGLLIAATHGHGAWCLDLDLAQWSDVTVSGLSTEQKTRNAAWADYDGDGDDDVFLAIDGPNVFFRNDGDLSFSELDVGVAGGSGDTRSGSWADYDNDGDPDLYVVNWMSPNLLYRNDEGSFIGLTNGVLGDAGKGYGASWVDYDSDGHVDLYVVNRGVNRLIRNHVVGGTRYFQDVTPDELVQAGNSTCASWADYDGDGDQDVYVTRSGSPDVLLRNDNLRFEVVTGGGLGADGKGRSSIWFDADGDEDLDLYVTRGDGPNLLLRYNGNGTFTSLDGGDATVAGNTFSVDAGDTDNDGDLDLFVGDRDGNYLLENRGNNQFTRHDGVPFGTGGWGRGVSFVDMNGDGALDIYIPKSGTRTNRILVQEGPAGNWLEVTLVGLASNSSGIGARIRMTLPSGQVLIRQVQSGGGLRSHPPLRAHFGLGDATSISSTQVVWPSGTVTTNTSGVVNEQLVLWETPFGARRSAGELAGGGAAAPGRVSANLDFSVGPSPFRGSTRIEFGLARLGSARVVVFDVTGRRVRQLADGQFPAGRHGIRWDGRNASGQRLASGVYFVRIETAERHETSRVVLLE